MDTASEDDQRQYVEIGPYLPVWKRSQRLRHRALITHPDAGFSPGKVGQLEPGPWYRWEDVTKDQSLPRRLFEVPFKEVFSVAVIVLMSILTAYNRGGYDGIWERVWLNSGPPNGDGDTNGALADRTSGRNPGHDDASYNFLVFITARCRTSLIDDLIVSFQSARHFRETLRIGVVIGTDLEGRARSGYLEPTSLGGVLVCPSEYFGFQVERIYQEVYLPLVKSFDGVPACIGQHVFVVIDEQSSLDHTCIVASDSDGSSSFLRVDIAVAMFYLVPIECLRMGIADFQELDISAVQQWQAEQTGNHSAVQIDAHDQVESVQEDRGRILEFQPEVWLDHESHGRVEYVVDYSTVGRSS